MIFVCKRKVVDPFANPLESLIAMMNHLLLQINNCSNCIAMEDNSQTKCSNF